MSAVLITRPVEQAARTARRLEQAGFLPITAPLLEIESLHWQAPDLPPQAILLTSANALPSLNASSLSRNIPVYAVGAQTARLTSESGFTSVQSAEGDSRTLYTLVRQSCSPGLGALLYLTGDSVTGNLATRLSADGYWVETRLAYRAHAAQTLPKAVAQALEQGQIDTVLLYSPRSAAIFSQLMSGNPARAHLRLVCLSPAVAKAAAAGWQRVDISMHPDEDRLLETLLTLPQANSL